MSMARDAAAAPMERLLIFTLDAQRYALPFECVERVVQVVEITPLPGAPGVVLGVIDLQGRLVVVVEPRVRFGLPVPERQLSQQLLVARMPGRSVALLVDKVVEVAHCAPGEIVAGDPVQGAGTLVCGVLRRADGLVLIHDLARFLSLDEQRQLDEALHHG